MESFIPLWEWDLPKKKLGKKSKGEKGEKSGKSRKGKAAANGTSTAVEARPISPDTDSSRPQSRQATVEDVPEDS